MSGELPHTGGPASPNGLIYMLVGGIATLALFVAGTWNRFAPAARFKRH